MVIMAILKALRPNSVGCSLAFCKSPQNNSHKRNNRTWRCEVSFMENASLTEKGGQLSSSPMSGDTNQWKQTRRMFHDTQQDSLTGSRPTRNVARQERKGCQPRLATTLFSYDGFTASLNLPPGLTKPVIHSAACPSCGFGLGNVSAPTRLRHNRLSQPIEQTKKRFVVRSTKS